MANPAITAIVAPPTILGEGPMWSVRDQALYWIDISGRRVLRHKPSTGLTETRDLPYAPGGIFDHAEGGQLLVTKKGLARFDFDSGALTSIKLTGVDFSIEVFNDGACDKMGRLWVGTRDLEVTNPRGSLYSLSHDYTVTHHSSGFVVSNGIAFSPDGRTLYHTETRPGRIDACDFDLASGTIANRRPLIVYALGDPAHPDGCTVDAEGGIWVAEVGASRISRYRPDGSLDRSIELPITRPTSVMFGGPDLATLYITSMRFRLSEEDLRQQPLAGCLLAVDVGVRGLPEPMFGGAA